MTAFNAVRFRVKPGRDQEFLDAHAKVQRNWAGLLHANIIKTGERTYCVIAEWADMDSYQIRLITSPGLALATNGTAC
jgi:quinol monooxygenase YgiN